MGDKVTAAAIVVALVCFGLVGNLGVDREWTWTLRAYTERATQELGPMSTCLLWWDGIVIASYLLAGVLLAWRNGARAAELGDGARLDPIATRIVRWTFAGLTCLVMAAIADVAEDVLSAVVLSDHEVSKTAKAALQAAAWLKWTAIVPGLGLLGVMGITSAVRTHDLLGPRATRGNADGLIRWKTGRSPRPTEWVNGEPRTGVCLSGGGIRSASFSLGALQAIRGSSLSRVSYVTSASGGGYIAAAWAALSRGAPPGERPFGPRSTHERWVRHHTNYLTNGVWPVLGALLTVVFGFVLNMLVVLVLLQVLVHPVGWVVQGMHPELEATAIVGVDHQPKLRIINVTAASSAQVNGKKATRPVFRIALGFDPKDDGTVDARDPNDRTLRVGPLASVSFADSVEKVLEPAGLDVRIVSGLVMEGTNGLEVIRQPEFLLKTKPACRHLESGKSVPCPAELRKQPRLEVDPVPDPSAGEASGARPSASLVRRLVHIDQQPRLDTHSGTGRRDLEAPAWIWWYLGSIAAVLIIAAVFRNPPIRKEYHPPFVVSAIAKLFVGAAALVLGLPYVAVNLSDWLHDLPGYHPASAGWQATFGVVLVVIPALKKLGGNLAKRTESLGRFRGRGDVVDAVLGVGAMGIVLSIFFALLNTAIAEGPDGRLEGAPFLPFPGGPDAWRWACWALIVVVLLLVPISSHTWSLYTVFRGGLHRAFFLKRVPPTTLQSDPGDGEERDVDRVVPMSGEDLDEWVWSPYTPGGPRVGLNGLGAAPEPQDPPCQWVICTTANIRGAGEAAPGRNAGSFTFSTEWVGGPEVGWIRTHEYLRRLSDANRHNVSVPSTVVMSAAAFSPAMGKASKGWQGRLFALVNLRLGVWAPNPMVVARQPAGGSFGRWRKPTLAWYLRELIGWYDRTAPYIYLTDGGHWDNLGLVELLRRGCTEIWMVSAAGDGVTSFETMGQAMALAREEIGVEFLNLELEPLRPRANDQMPKAGRRLLRSGKAVETAPASHKVAQFRYPPTAAHPEGRSGKIYVIEAALLGDLPWDVHAYGEANSDFPDISTGYQLLDHRDFEAYRMLGYTQTARALAYAGYWPAGNADPPLSVSPAAEPPEPARPTVVVGGTGAPIAVTLMGEQSPSGEATSGTGE